MVDTPDGCAVIQRDLDKLEKQAHRSLNEIQQMTCMWWGVTPYTSTGGGQLAGKDLEKKSQGFWWTTVGVHVAW